MVEPVQIGLATLYDDLTRSQRCRLRKKGIDIPRKAMPKGYKQSPEHVQKRKRFGAENWQWLGDNVPPKVGYKRAQRVFKELGPCIVCGAEKTERHHKDKNPANNSPDNVTVLCRSCHVKEHARLRNEARQSCAKK